MTEENATRSASLADLMDRIRVLEDSNSDEDGIEVWLDGPSPRNNLPSDVVARVTVWVWYDPNKIDPSSFDA